MPIYSNMTKIRNISSKVMTNHGSPLSFRFYTLLPTCWIFKNTGFQVGLRSFFMTSVLQMGIWVPPSTNLEINKKGSCMTNKNIADTKTHDSHLLAKKGKYPHTLFEKRSLFSKSEHRNVISTVVFELTHSSACTNSFPQLWEWFDLAVSSLYRSNVNDRPGFVIICIGHIA